MGVGVYPSTIRPGYTPTCNDCGIRLCWDISEVEYEEDREFWESWICCQCNGGAPMSLSAYRKRKNLSPGEKPGEKEKSEEKK